MKEKEAISNAEKYLESARDNLTEGRDGPMILNLFAAGEYAINVHLALIGRKPSTTHEGKMAVMTLAYKNGRITAGEYKAYKRVVDLKPTAQYHPYIKAKQKRQMKKGEAENLFRGVESLVERMRKLVEQDA